MFRILGDLAKFDKRFEFWATYLQFQRMFRILALLDDLLALCWRTLRRKINILLKPSRRERSCERSRGRSRER